MKNPFKLTSVEKLIVLAIILVSLFGGIVAFQIFKLIYFLSFE